MSSESTATSKPATIPLVKLKYSKHAHLQAGPGRTACGKRADLSKGEGFLLLAKWASDAIELCPACAEIAGR